MCSKFQPLHLTQIVEALSRHITRLCLRSEGLGLGVLWQVRRGCGGAGRAHACRPAGCTCTVRHRLVRRRNGVAALSHSHCIITAGKCLTHALLGCRLLLSHRQM